MLYIDKHSKNVIRMFILFQTHLKQLLTIDKSICAHLDGFWTEVSIYLIDLPTKSNLHGNTPQTITDSQPQAHPCFSCDTTTIS